MYSVSMRPITWDYLYYYSSCLRAVPVGSICYCGYSYFGIFFFTHNDRRVNLVDEQQREEEEAEAGGKSLRNV